MYYIVVVHVCVHAYDLCFNIVEDASSSRNTEESQIDSRVEEALLMEDLDVLIDLRHLTANKSDRYEVFWLSFLNKCTAVHKRSMIQPLIYNQKLFQFET